MVEPLSQARQGLGKSEPNRCGISPFCFDPAHATKALQSFLNFRIGLLEAQLVHGRPAVDAEAFAVSQERVSLLARRFLKDKSHYLSRDYVEADVRKDFIDPLLTALGWVRSSDPYRQEVKIERRGKKGIGQVDYAISLAPDYRRIRFYVEAKRPLDRIDTPDNCFQSIRYSWPKGLPLVVLTDFNHIHLIDSRYKPDIKDSNHRVLKTWNCSEYDNTDNFGELYWLLSRKAVESGSIDRFVETIMPPPQRAEKQYALPLGEAREFDDVFLSSLDDWRTRLAMTFKKANDKLNGEQLTECVQRTLDRLIFIRFLEDKGIEPTSIIRSFSHSKNNWRAFSNACRRLDISYNGIVFKHHSIVDATSFQPDNRAFEDICDDLTDEHSPYNFESIPIEILGRIYERFLGKVVELSHKEVRISEKESVRRAGGVYYTPDYVTNYMARSALDEKLRSLKPDGITALRIIDTSCGSGSFLIAVFELLVEATTAYFLAHPRESKKGDLVERDGVKLLSLKKRREILEKCLYGVDIDPQAVEVAQLSLYLKLMESETPDSAHHSQVEMGAALLPSLAANIINGNSVVKLDDLDDLFSKDVLKKVRPMDFKQAFKGIMYGDKFDLVIGNPPYIKEYTNREAFAYTYKSPYYQGKMDIWYMFACNGLDLLKENGTLAFIATNNWFTNAGASKLRAKLNSEARILRVVDFGNYI